MSNPNQLPVTEVGFHAAVGNAERYRNMNMVRRMGTALVAEAAGALGHPERADQLDADRTAANIEDIAVRAGYKIEHGPQPAAPPQEQQK